MFSLGRSTMRIFSVRSPWTSTSCTATSGPGGIAKQKDWPVIGMAMSILFYRILYIYIHYIYIYTLYICVRILHKYEYVSKWTDISSLVGILLSIPHCQWISKKWDGKWSNDQSLQSPQSWSLLRLRTFGFLPMELLEMELTVWWIWLTFTYSHSPSCFSQTNTGI